MADQAIGTRTRERGGRQWLRVFVVGLLLWVASVVVTFATSNTNLVPPSSCSAASWSRWSSPPTPLAAPTRS